MKGLVTSGVSVSVANVATMPMGQFIFLLSAVSDTLPLMLPSVPIMFPAKMQMSQRSGCSFKLLGWQMAQSLLAW